MPTGPRPSSLDVNTSNTSTEEGTVSTTETSTEAANVADIIRSAAAWWKLAAETLEAGDVDQALTYAKLGRFGTEDAVERIEARRPVTQPDSRSDSDASAS
ncbi:MAG: hypothetical protein WD734_00435 [Dehalococcoidia bacterium]